MGYQNGYSHIFAVVESGVTVSDGQKLLQSPFWSEVGKVYGTLELVRVWFTQFDPHSAPTRRFRSLFPLQGRDILWFPRVMGSNRARE